MAKNYWYINIVESKTGQQKKSNVTIFSYDLTCCLIHCRNTIMFASIALLLFSEFEIAHLNENFVFPVKKAYYHWFYNIFCPTSITPEL